MSERLQRLHSAESILSGVSQSRKLVQCKILRDWSQCFKVSHGLKELRFSNKPSGFYYVMGCIGFLRGFSILCMAIAES